MYVCVDVCVCVRVYAYLCVCACLHVFLCLHLYLCVCAGTDEAAIIQIMASHSNEQRREIEKQFKTMYGRVRNTVDYYQYL